MATQLPAEGTSVEANKELSEGSIDTSCRPSWDRERWAEFSQATRDLSQGKDKSPKGDRAQDAADKNDEVLSASPSQSPGHSPIPRTKSEPRPPKGVVHRKEVQRVKSKEEEEASGVRSHASKLKQAFKSSPGLLKKQVKKESISGATSSSLEDDEKSLRRKQRRSKKLSSGSISSGQVKEDLEGAKRIKSTPPHPPPKQEDVGSQRKANGSLPETTSVRRSTSDTELAMMNESSMDNSASSDSDSEVRRKRAPSEAKVASPRSPAQSPRAVSPRVIDMVRTHSPTSPILPGRTDSGISRTDSKGSSQSSQESSDDTETGRRMPRPGWESERKRKGAETLRKGWLEKKTKPVGRQEKWKRCYFMIGDARMYQFNSPADARPKNTYALHTCSSHLVEGSLQVIQVSFLGARDPLLLRAESAQDAELWLASIRCHSQMIGTSPAILAEKYQEATVVANSAGRITHFNRAACKMFGYDAEEVIGHKVSVLMPLHLATSHALFMTNYAKTEKRHLIGKPRKLPILTKAGIEEDVWLHLGEYIDKGRRTFISCFYPLEEVSDLSDTEDSDGQGQGRSQHVEVEAASASDMAKTIELLRSQLSISQQKLVEHKKKLETAEELIDQYQKERDEMIEELAKLKQGSKKYPPSPRIEAMKDGKVGGRKFEISLTKPIIIEKISDGQGERATVFECVVDGWTCAMKEIDLRHTPEKRVAMFEKEISVLTQLPTHPNLCRYLFHERKGHKLRLFMTKYSGTLQWKLNEMRLSGQQFEPIVIARITLDIVRGMLALHRHRILHRDLKSDNIFCMLDEENEVKSVAIGDFDTARFLVSNDRAKTCIGTPGYTAPEVLLAYVGEQYDLKADIWGVGMVLYELLELKRPFHDIEVTAEITQAILDGRRPPLSSHSEEYETLLHIHLACTNADASKRPTLDQIRFLLLDAFW